MTNTWPHKVRLLLDSGVFSAWNLGKTLDMKAYIDYVKRNKKWLFSYVNVDVIPGEYGRKRTRSEVEKSAKLSYDNLQTMKSHGLRPIPVFHQGEQLYWLERLLADGETYIGISTAKDLRGKEHLHWLDTVFSMLTDTNGYPIVKVHGFGITNPRFLLRYPFYSVDSTTWALSPAYGHIFVPVYVKGEPDYLRLPNKMIMSGVPHANKSSQNTRYEGLSPIGQECVTRFLAEEVGINVTQARCGYSPRQRAVLIYYLHLADAIKDRNPLKHGLNIMFVTTLTREFGNLMNDLGANTRLLSYWLLKDRPDQALIDFVTKGISGGENRARHAKEQTCLDIRASFYTRGARQG
jgi:hypothetical protein